MTTEKSIVLTYEGVPVRVYLDDRGRPLRASAVRGIERPDDPEHVRAVKLAVSLAFERALYAPKEVQRKRSSAKAAAESAKKRASAIADEWLAKAHKQYPHFGRDKLTEHARRLAAKAEIALDKRGEITEERARLFLERKRKGSAP